MVKPFIQPVRRRRGNPNWGRPLPPAPAVATEFDQGAYGHLGAKPKHGKSCISRSESVCVAKGTPFLGRNVQQGEVLLCSLEDPRQHVDNCLQVLGYDKEKDARIHIVEKLPKNIIETVDILGEFLTKHPGIRFVVFDTLAKVLRAKDSGNYDEMLPLCEKLHDLATV